MKKIFLMSVGVGLIALHAGAVSAPTPVIDLNAIDSSINPCEDFYHYACGNWIKQIQLPADRNSYNRQTSALQEETTKRLNAILVDYTKGSFEVKSRYGKELGAFYRSCMDEDAISARGPVALKAQMNLIHQIQDSQDLGRVIGNLQDKGVQVLFAFGSSTDLTNSDRAIAQLMQGGLSFSDRSYYFKTDAKSVEIRNRFVAHAQKMFRLTGMSEEAAIHAGENVLRFETALANKSLPVEDMQDTTQLHHPMKIMGVISLTPKFDWQNYFAAVGIKRDLGKVNVATPLFFQGLNDTLTQFSLKDVKAYLKYRFLYTFSSKLGKPFRDEVFAYWHQYLLGTKEQSPDWKRCTLITEADMTDALVEAFVNSFDRPEEVRLRASTMIEQIKAAFGQNLSSLDWLDKGTRKSALQKLAKVVDKVGYPQKLRTFEGLDLRADDFFANAMALGHHSSQEDLKKIGLPTDRKLWDMAAWDQNAYYDPTSNQMVFPLGALVPPIFDLNFSQGANFGSVGGGWMGHELTHGFDSDGRHFDGHGDLKDWWTKATSNEFDRRTACLVDQGNHYEVLPGLMANGKQTLTENLADQGGTKIGYRAFLKATEGKVPSANLGIYSERQQFWLAYAQSWCSKETEEQIRLQVATDVHPPAEFRCNVVVMNRPEFANDFACRAGQRMAPVNRCSIW